MKKFVYSLTAIALIASAIGGVVFWEFYLKERLNTVEVVVAATRLEPRAKIKADDLKIERREISTLPSQYVTDPSQLVDQEVWGVIEAKDVISEGKLITGIAPQGDQKIYPIPSEWIEAVPGSLRRSDKVDVYALVDTNRIKPEQEQTKLANGALTPPPLSAHASDQPVLQGITVAYVKDSANQEVKPKEESSSTANDRQDLTANPFKLELILTQEQFGSIKASVENGYKLLFAY